MTNDDPPPASHVRRTLGHFATGVAVVTGFDTAPIGMTIQSFVSVSLEPLLVSFTPAKTSRTWARIRTQGELCINILAADQESVARRFAQPNVDRFNRVEWHPAPSGTVPIIAGSMAWLDCAIEGIHDAGDHDVVLCLVRGYGVERDCAPLLFFRGTYSSIAATPPDAWGSFDGIPHAW
jgi:3-hydroxy-9,10-secoandrosta-1,3,5(10)-triene-9,17-dione monooxygenase reductase component